MSLNLNLGLFLITQNHVFPSSWPVWVESLYFDLHYKYMFYNNCYTCALYIVHHYDISYLTPFVFFFFCFLFLFCFCFIKKDGLKCSLLPSFPPSSLIPICNTWIVMRFRGREWHLLLCKKLVQSICLSNAFAWGMHWSRLPWGSHTAGLALPLSCGADPAPNALTEACL